jgi:hypothetical protein
MHRRPIEATLRKGQDHRRAWVGAGRLTLLIASAGLLLAGAALLPTATAEAREGSPPPGYVPSPGESYGFNSDIEALLAARGPAARPGVPVLASLDRRTQGEPRKEIACLALNVYFESRSEPDLGKRAVAHVVMNRVASKKYPDTICEVVRQGGEVRRNRCQFSWWCDGESDEPGNRGEWERASTIALQVYWGRSADPTGGALWYHADYVRPVWRKKLLRGPKIGRHIFYRTAATEAAPGTKTWLQLASRKRREGPHPR